MTALSMELAAIAERLRTQDNSATAAPIYVVQQKRRIYGFDPSFADQVVWIDGESVEADEETTKKLEAGHDAGEDEPEHWIRTAFLDQWEFVSVFLTHAAAQQYIETQRHNLKEPRVYVESGHRNPEWQALRKIIAPPAPPTPAPTPSEPDFWSCDDTAERLHHEDMEEAVHATIEDQAELNESWRSTIKRLAPLEVYGWTRDEVDDKRIQAVSEWAVERIQDDIDDELSDPEGGVRVLKDDQARELEQTIIEKLTELRSAGQLVPWSCSQTEKRTLTEAELLEMFASQVEDDDRARAAHAEGGGR